MECIGQSKFLNTLNNMTKDNQWRVRMAVYELLGKLGLIYGKAEFMKEVYDAFISYLTNTAAAVRSTGVKMSEKLAE